MSILVDGGEEMSGVQRFQRLMVITVMFCGACCFALCPIILAQKSENVASASEVASGRLEVQSTTSPLRAGEVNRIAINPHGYVIQQLTVDIAYCNSDWRVVRKSNPREVSIIKASEGGEYIQVMPDGIGHVDIKVLALFTDGSADIAEIRADVVLSEHYPTSLSVFSNGSSSVMLKLGAPGDEFTERSVSFRATYNSGKDAVWIPGEKVDISIVSDSSGTPVVKVVQEASGIKILSLHPGHSLIVASFGGQKAAVCAVVVKRFRFSYDPSECRELLPAGVELPPDANAAPPKVQSKPENM